jgi:predicted ATPase
MLTRIEIDGFNTFEEFAVDFGAFTVIVGPNACGKSNLFDAIQLLSSLASHDLATAVKRSRGEPWELFRRGSDGSPGDRMSFAVDLLLDPQTRDPWGNVVETKHSRVRYEIAIARRRDERGIDRLYVDQEKARPILKGEDTWKPGGRSPSAGFRDAYIRFSGRRQPWLETSVEKQTDPPKELRSFQIRQDGHQGRKRPAVAAEATVLSSIGSAEFPHLYAIAQELRSWRFLQLDPVAMRSPSPIIAPDRLESNGANLATVLARIRAETREDHRPGGDLADIAADLTALIGGQVDLEVTEDRESRTYRITMGLRGRDPFSSRVVSDGTLRSLALLTALHDPQYRGLICLEEPENGVHPAVIRPLFERIRDLLSDPAQEAVESMEPLSQMIVNSHSPVVVSQVLNKGEALFADMTKRIDSQSRRVSLRTRMRPVKPEVQSGFSFVNNGRGSVSAGEVRDYLSTVDQGGV